MLTERLQDGSDKGNDAVNERADLEIMFGSLLQPCRSSWKCRVLVNSVVAQAIQPPLKNKRLLFQRSFWGGGGEVDSSSRCHLKAVRTKPSLQQHSQVGKSELTRRVSVKYWPPIAPDTRGWRNRRRSESSGCPCIGVCTVPPLRRPWPQRPPRKPAGAAGPEANPSLPLPSPAPRPRCQLAMSTWAKLLWAL